MKSLLALVVASVLLTLGGCAGSPAARSRDGEGGHPLVVSLNPCTDAIAAEIAAPGQLLAISHYSHDPSASSMDPALARSFAATGGTVEEVLALDPDMVIAGAFLPPSTRRALEDLGIRVETFGIASSVAQSQAQVARMGELLGEQGKARALSRRIEDAVQDARTDGTSVDAVLWQPGGIVPGEGTLVGELLRNAGFANYTAARGLGQASYLPLEAVLADPPQVLLIAGNERGQQHPALREIPGMTVARFDPSLLYCGGPTIIRAAERLAHVRASVE